MNAVAIHLVPEKRMTNLATLSRHAKDDYLAQVQAFPLTSIKDEKHLQKAQEVLDAILAKPRLSKGELEYVDALSDLVLMYENVHHQIPAPSDAELLRHLLEARGITPSELHRQTGVANSTISAILAGKRGFAKDTINKLSAYFKMDKGLFAANF
jgi:HTH-type transcriptional regulator / antitoxin HigA